MAQKIALITARPLRRFNSRRVGGALLTLAFGLGCSGAANAQARDCSPIRAKQPSPPWRVAIDIGHTLAEPGAISARGQAEFEFNRLFAGQLACAFRQAGLIPRIINSDGQIPSLAARAAAAGDAHFLISIHHDSVQPRYLQSWQWNGREESYSDQFKGHSLFVSRKNAQLPPSLLCASSVGARLRRMDFEPARHHGDSLPDTPRPWADEGNGVYYYDNLAVLRLSVPPAVLFEAGVIKHRDEELALLDPMRQKRMADALVTGIRACLQVYAQ